MFHNLCCTIVIDYDKRTRLLGSGKEGEDKRKTLHGVDLNRGVKDNVGLCNTPVTFLFQREKRVTKKSYVSCGSFKRNLLMGKQQSRPVGGATLNVVE